MRSRLGTFIGTPAQFLAQAQSFVVEHPHLLFIALDGRVYVRSEDWTPLVTVGSERPGASALITPRELPNGHCNLLLRELTGDWAKLEKHVDLFLNWLRQAGWIAVMNAAPLAQALMAIRNDAWKQAVIQQVRNLVNDDQPAAQPELDGQPAAEVLDQLTDRETEIAHLLAQGKDDREIAEMLVISYRTVRTHRENIAKKWNIQQTLELMRHEAKRRMYGRT